MCAPVFLNTSILVIVGVRHTVLIDILTGYVLTNWKVRDTNMIRQIGIRQEGKMLCAVRMDLEMSIQGPSDVNIRG
jgi:hypothetical protein